jgi:hypothetical protein
MRVDDKRLDQIARPIIVALWNDLQPLLSETLREQALESGFIAESLSEALVDLSLGPGESRLAQAVIEEAAVDLAGDAFFLEFCLDCIEDGLEQAPVARRPPLVARAAAALALRDHPDYGIDRPDDRERPAVRAGVREMAELGRRSLPRLAAALAELAAEPLPSLDHDRILQAVMERRLSTTAEPN